MPQIIITYPALHLPHSSPAPSFPDYPTLHKCPMYIAQLIDPMIRSWNLGPGFCTRDNLFGVSYLIVLGVNYILAMMAFFMVVAVLRKVVCCRCGGRDRKRGEDMGGDARGMDRAERGEGGWMGKVCFGDVMMLGWEYTNGFCSRSKLFSRY